MANSYHSLLFHLVFSTKARQPLIRTEFRDELYAYMGGIIRKMDGQLLEIGGMPDHVHLLVRWHPDEKLSVLMRETKGWSSRWAHEDGHHHFAWQRGYGVFSESHSQLERVKTCILHQEEHHRTRTYGQEYFGLLRRHDIVFEEAYALD